LNDSLKKLTLHPMLLEPKLLKRLVAFEEQLLIKFLDPFDKARVVFVAHFD
jgi:hypothetical protein